MKKKNRPYIYGGLGLIIIVLIFTFLFKNDNEYKKSVALLPEIEVDNLKKKVSDNDSLYVYIGNEDCPFCVEFLPKLVEANKDVKKHIYHLEADKNEKVARFFQEINIKYIPSLLKIEDGKIINLNINEGIKNPKEYSLDKIREILEKN